MMSTRLQDRSVPYAITQGLRVTAGILCAAVVTPAFGQAGSESAESAPDSLRPVLVEDLGITYEADTAFSSLRTTQKLERIPRSLQVVNTEILRDQGVYRFDDVYQNITGANQFSYNQDFQIRGFRTQRDQVTFNGLRANPYDNFVNPITANVDRIEVLKGPSALLQGSGAPGGTVNLVTKKPLAVQRNEIAVTAGEYDTYRASLDSTGPLTDDRNLLYRISASADSSRSFRDNVDERNWQIAPSLTWLASEDTIVDLEAEVFEVRDRGKRDRGIIAPGGDLDYVDPSFNAAEPTDRHENSGFALQLGVEHALSRNWTAAVKGRYSESEFTNLYHEPRFLQDDGRTLTRQWRDLAYNFYEWNLNAELRGEFDTGSLAHDLNIGVDAGRRRREDDRFAFVDDPNVEPIDVFAPDYGQTDPSSYSYDTVARSGETRQRAVYIRDILTLRPDLRLVIGGRYAHFEEEALTETGTQGRSGSETAFTGQAGIVYDLTPEHRVYASYTEGFEPQVGFGPEAGGPFDPLESVQLETGLKSSWFDGRLSTTAALYEITRENELVTDPDDTTRRQQVGEFRSRGFELDAVGRLTDTWSVTAGYAYNDARITEDTNPDNVGQRAANAPYHSARLWTRYDWPGLNLGLGGGVNYVGERETFDDAVQLPSYTTVDLAAYYFIGDVDLALNVSNVFDEDHFVGGYNQRIVFPGAPRTVSLTARYAF